VASSAYSEPSVVSRILPKNKLISFFSLLSRRFLRAQTGADVGRGRSS
jgi:hypothetical protein